jgi:hypothetical protein
MTWWWTKGKTDSLGCPNNLVVITESFKIVGEGGMFLLVFRIFWVRVVCGLGWRVRGGEVRGGENLWIGVL